MEKCVCCSDVFNVKERESSHFFGYTDIVESLDSTKELLQSADKQWNTASDVNHSNTQVV